MGNENKRFDIYNEWKKGSTFYFHGNKLNSKQAETIVNFAELKANEVAFNNLYSNSTRKRFSN